MADERVGDEERLQVGHARLTLDELRARVQVVAPGVICYEELDGQTVGGAQVMLGQVKALADGMDQFAVIVDLRDVPTRPSAEYREFMVEWAKGMPPFHAAYVLPPVGALTRMALRWVALRVMNVHESSSSSDHESVEDAVAHCTAMLTADAHEA
ncbi:MAG: hypothetical protein R3B72_49780 [Polyangiaceae bacterium]